MIYNSKVTDNSRSGYKHILVKMKTEKLYIFKEKEVCILVNAKKMKLKKNLLKPFLKKQANMI